MADGVFEGLFKKTGCLQACLLAVVGTVALMAWAVLSAKDVMF